MMTKGTIAAIAVVALLGAGLVVAQTGGSTSTATPPATATTPAATTTPAGTDARFTAADSDKNGTLEGAELDTWKADLTRIDTDKDGKVSKAEFAAATSAGVVK